MGIAGALKPGISSAWRGDHGRPLVPSGVHIFSPVANLSIAFRRGRPASSMLRSRSPPSRGFNAENLLEGRVHVEIRTSPSLLRVYNVDLPKTDPSLEKLKEVAEWSGPAAIGELTLTGWDFDEPWQIVQGKWTLRIFHEGKQLAEQSFVVE